MTGLVLFNGQEFIVRDSDGFNLGVCGGYLGHRLRATVERSLARQAVAACLAEGRSITLRKVAPHAWNWEAQ